MFINPLSRFKSSVIKGKLFRIVTRVMHRKPYLFDLNEIKPGLSLPAVAM